MCAWASDKFKCNIFFCANETERNKCNTTEKATNEIVHRVSVCLCVLLWNCHNGKLGNCCKLRKAVANMWQQVGKAKANALCLCLCVRAGFVWQSSIGHTCRDVYAHTFIYTYIHTCLKKMCKLSWAKTMKNPPKNKNNKNAQHQQRRWAQVRDREERESRRLAESGINRWIHQYQCSVHTYTHTHRLPFIIFSNKNKTL